MAKGFVDVSYYSLRAGHWQRASSMSVIIHSELDTPLADHLPKDLGSVTWTQTTEKHLSAFLTPPHSLRPRDTATASTYALSVKFVPNV